MDSLNICVANSLFTLELPKQKQKNLTAYKNKCPSH